MSLIKKRDLKQHFAARRRKGTHPILSCGQGSGPGFPAIDPPTADAIAAVFIADFSSEHCSAGGTITSVVMLDAGGTSEVPEEPSIQKP